VVEIFTGSGEISTLADKMGRGRRLENDIYTYFGVEAPENEHFRNKSQILLQEVGLNTAAQFRQLNRRKAKN